jgi:putative hydroxymethylpyrimidine transport system permease protein
MLMKNVVAGTTASSVETLPSYTEDRTSGVRVTARRFMESPAGRYAPPALLIIALIAAWQILAGVFHVKSYVLPTPSDVINSLSAQHTEILTNTLFTMKEIVLGFAMAVAIGLALAVLLHLSRLMRQTVYPILVASQTVPIVVLAPILVVMFGLGIMPKLAIVTLVCFFPIVVNAVDGLRSVDPEYVRMMRTLHASRWGTFRRVELPSALPLIFSGARIAATYAAIGAVFGEYSGSNEGLGYMIQQATPDLNTALMFAAVLILTILALTLFGLVNLAERIIAPWARITKQGGR